MKDPFNRFGGLSAILVGVLSILYAIFFFVITRQAEYLGTVGGWVILALSGIFSSAAYVALFLRLRPVSEGAALWGLVLGVGSSFATLVHGGYQVVLVTAARGADESLRTAIEISDQVPSEVDPRGLAAFGVVGVVSFVFGWLITRRSASAPSGDGSTLPSTLGYVGMFNALLLVVLYFATIAGAQSLIRISAGLTAIIVGPIWWIWLGTQLMKETA
jgi:hypothetical protein